MQIKEYFKLFPNEKVYCSKGVENEGMLEFTKDTACTLAGPFNKVYGYYCIDTSVWPLMSKEQIKQDCLRKYWIYPKRFNLTAKSIVRPDYLIPQLTKDELNYLNKLIEECTREFSIETPWRLYICGNDDTSYSKFFATKELALEELKLLEACQPLDFFKDIQDNDFVFTN